VVGALHRLFAAMVVIRELLDDEDPSPLAHLPSSPSPTPALRQPPPSSHTRGLPAAGGRASPHCRSPRSIAGEPCAGPAPSLPLPVELPVRVGGRFSLHLRANPLLVLGEASCCAVMLQSLFGDVAIGVLMLDVAHNRVHNIFATRPQHARNIYPVDFRSSS
jgi:hypothetical protein